MSKKVERRTGAIGLKVQPSLKKVSKKVEKRTGAIGLKVQPSLKKALERAAEADHRSVASLLEKVATEYLKARGFLKAED
jgi:hypothetical protein